MKPVPRKRFTLYDYGLLSLENGLLSMITVYCLSKTVCCLWLRFTVSRKQFTVDDYGLVSLENGLLSMITV